MKLQRKEHIHMKNFLQYTTNLEALVKAVCTCHCYFIDLSRMTQDTMEVFFKISTLNPSSIAVLSIYTFTKWLSHCLYINCR